MHCAATAVQRVKPGFREAGNIDPERLIDVKEDCVLFYHPSCSDLAHKVAAAKGDIELGEIDWGCACCSLSVQVAQLLQMLH